VNGRLTLAAALATAVALAAPAVANAATLTATPEKSCYIGSGILDPETRLLGGEPILIAGSGYTPGGQVSVSVDGRTLGTDDVDAAGNFAGRLRPTVRQGERVKTITATDTSNPANTDSVPLRASELAVNLRPKHGRPNRRFRIGARGFTTGKALYVHVVRKGYRRTRRVGRLKGRCHKLVVRKRLFPRSIPNGRYRVQFDTRRRYRRDREVKVVRSFTVSRTTRRG